MPSNDMTAVLEAIRKTRMVWASLSVLAPALWFPSIAHDSDTFLDEHVIEIGPLQFGIASAVTLGLICGFFALIARFIRSVVIKLRDTSRPRMKAAPGSALLAFLPYVFSRRTIARVFMQGVADMREEYLRRSRTTGRALRT